MELKSLLVSVLENLEFVDSGADIEGHTQIVTKPYVVGHLDQGSQMPLYMRLI